VFEDGYRWVNSTSEYMVFEKEVEEIDGRQLARDLIRDIDEMHVGGCRCEDPYNITCPVCRLQDMLGPLAGVLPVVEEEEGADDL